MNGSHKGDGWVGEGGGGRGEWEGVVGWVGGGMGREAKGGLRLPSSSTVHPVAKWHK